VLLLGTDEMCELSLCHIIAHGAGSVVTIDQARDLAEKLGGRWTTLADRRTCMQNADIVIAATGCPHVVLTRDEAERMARQRNRVALVIMDSGTPRMSIPMCGRWDYALRPRRGWSGLCSSQWKKESKLQSGAERIVAAEAQAFCCKLHLQMAVSTMVALRNRPDEICRARTGVL
jgi:glutamyl-tRNA reductase